MKTYQNDVQQHFLLLISVLLIIRIQIDRVKITDRLTRISPCPIGRQLWMTTKDKYNKWSLWMRMMELVILAIQNLNLTMIGISNLTMISTSNLTLIKILSNSILNEIYIIWRNILLNHLLIRIKFSVYIYGLGNARA